jgi:methylated-DNA-protein-cysteine methyltransferase-like protein
MSKVVRRAGIKAAGSPPESENSTSLYTRIYAVVKKIPRGKVASYGQVARIAGLERHARLAGYALHSLPDDLVNKIPWHRVINAQGYVSIRANPIAASLQKKLLEHEGILFDSRDRIDMKKFGWKK